MFWKRTKSDFISLNLSGPDEPAIEQAAEPVAETPVEKPIERVVEAPVEKVVAVPVVVEPTPPVQANSIQPSQEAKPVVTAPVRPQTSTVSAPVAVAETAEDEGFMKRFRKAISSTRENISSRLEDVVKGKKQIDAATLEDLEEALIGADIGVQTTMEIIENVRKQVDRQTLNDVDELKRSIKQNLLDILENAERSRGVASETTVPDDVRPYVMMIVGVMVFAQRMDFARLRELGIDYLQGYLAHRPEPLAGVLDARIGGAAGEVCGVQEPLALALAPLLGRQGLQRQITAQQRHHGHQA